MATSLTLQNDASLAQGYVKVNGTTSATFTTSGITGNLVGNVTGSLTQGGSLTLATAQTASGTAVDFTGIPSWVKRVIVSLAGVSTNGTSEVIFRLGTSGGVQSTGYLSSSAVVAAAVLAANDTTGFRIYNAGAAATDLRNGALTLSLLDSATGTWSATGIFGQSDVARINFIGGSKALSGTLDRIRITTVNGTDTFNSGTINISFEG
jgi:hypothetical protein